MMVNIRGNGGDQHGFAFCYCSDTRSVAALLETAELFCLKSCVDTLSSS